MKKLKKGIPFLIYMLIWSLYILFAWSRTHPGQIIEVSLFILYLVLPASAFIISVVYGQSDHRAIYLLTLFFGMMELLGCYLGFIYVSLTDIEKILAPSSEIVLYGVFPSLLGIMIGQYINKQNRYKM
ncbi:hypothetical protein [uncultured Catenibacterium sp.]|uniref:hypothetical protein n=1 Tax=uncultured Catenibacterium sp. TaxID=286142 RepID=UPI002591E293|nr:hypothetical protein [uncultured Catenibacterium sp.]